MQAITRYILSQILNLALFVTVGLTLTVWLSQSVRLIDYIVNRGVPASTFLTFIALLLPYFLSIVLPIAIFCAILFVYNKLTLDSEMVALRAVGLSQMQLAKPALIAAGCVTIIAYCVSLYFLPLSYRAFKDLQHQIRNEYSALLLREGVFNTPAPGITVYVRERGADDEFRGILVHDNRDRNNPVTMMAERGALVVSESGPRVVMVNGNRQEVKGAGGHLSLLYFDRYTVEFDDAREQLRTGRLTRRERFLPELLNPSDAGNDPRHRNEMIAEGHQRLVAPFYVMTFVMIGLTALLAGEFNRRGQGRRILIAILVVATIEGLSLALLDLARQSHNFIPVMYASAILPIVACVYLLHRRPRRPAAIAAAAEAVVP